jgi:hypothetical protein
MTRAKGIAEGKEAAAPTPAARFDVPEFMVPKSLAEVRELARLIGLAEWAPDSYRDLDGNYLQQKIELAIMHGATVGLGPIAAVQSIAVIDGMPTIWGDGALSIVERSGLLEDMLEEYQTDPDQGLTAICTMRRRRRPTAIVNRFSMAMAEQAHLTRKEGPWQSYPQRMLKMRARSWTIRDGFADVLRGLHIREEVDDFIETGGLWPQLLASAQEGARSGLRRNGAARPHRTPLEPKEPLPDLGAAGSGTAAQAPKAEVPAMARTEPGSVDEPSADPETAAAEATEPETPTTSPSADPEPAAPEESFTLADAEGGFIDVTGAEALRAEFERLFFDPHLSPDQILGLWESNEAARLALARRFGPAALAPAGERLAVARKARAGQRDDRAPANGDGEVLSTPSVPERAAGRVRRRWAVQRPRTSQREATTPRSRKPVSSQGDPGPAAPAANLAASLAATAEGNRTASPATRPGGENRGTGAGSPRSEPHRPGLDVCDAPTAPVAGLAISIDPSWGEQRVFRHYRAYLAAFRGKCSSQLPDIAGFRAANSAIEDRLRQRLPGLMQQLDALYGAEPAAPIPGLSDGSAR